MSKKLAEGIDGLVLDVKVGERRVHEDASSAARALCRARCVELGHARGPARRVRAHGHGRSRSAARSATPLEVREAIDVLRGGGPADIARARCTCSAPRCSCSSASASTRRRAGGAPSRRVARGRRALEVFARWSRRRAAIPTSGRLPRLRSCARRVRPSTVSSRAQRARHRPRRSFVSEPAGSRKDAFRRPRDRCPVPGQARRPRSQSDSRSRRFTPATSRRQSRRSPRLPRCYRSGSEPPQPAPLVLEVLELEPRRGSCTGRSARSGRTCAAVTLLGAPALVRDGHAAACRRPLTAPPSRPGARLAACPSFPRSRRFVPGSMPVARGRQTLESVDDPRRAADAPGSACAVAARSRGSASVGSVVGASIWLSSSRAIVTSSFISE